MKRYSRAKTVHTLRAVCLVLCLIILFLLSLIRDKDWQIKELKQSIQSPPATLSAVPMAYRSYSYIREMPVCKKTDNGPRYISLGVFKVTAYCPCKACCDKNPEDPAYGITATGTVATEDQTVAVDPDVVPLGTTIYINGQAYIAEDTGGAIKGNRIDLFFSNHQDALNWGVQKLEVFICP